MVSEVKCLLGWLPFWVPSRRAPRIWAQRGDRGEGQGSQQGSHLAPCDFAAIRREHLYNTGGWGCGLSSIPLCSPSLATHMLRIIFASSLHRSKGGTTWDRLPGPSGGCHLPRAEDEGGSQDPGSRDIGRGGCGISSRTPQYLPFTLTTLVSLIFLQRFVGRFCGYPPPPGSNSPPGSTPPLLYSHTERGGGICETGVLKGF